MLAASGASDCKEDYLGSEKRLTVRLEYVSNHVIFA